MTIKIMFTVMGVVCLLTSCNHAEHHHEKNTSLNKIVTMVPPPIKKKFEGVQFASRIDTICGMPIKAGIEDTVVWKGKAYGFCATACKEEFVKKLQSQHKR